MSYGDLALGAQGAGALISVLGAFAGASAQRSQLQFQSDMAGINAGLSEQAALAALLAGQRQEQVSQIATANLKSTQRAALAANGVDLGEGSAARVQASADVLGQIDANTIHANAVRSAWGYRTQQTNFQNEARQRQAAASAVSPLMSAGTTLLTGASQLATSWYSLNKAGALDSFKAVP